MKVQINGVDVDVSSETLTYDDVVRLAFPNSKVRLGCSIVYSRPIVFDGLPSRHSAMLLPGKSIEVRDGLRITADWTGNA